jgi:hypothetical protein
MADTWMPPKLRAILTYVLNGDTLTKDITNDITNWGELMTTLQRDGISGVFMSVDMPVKVAFEAKKILHDIFFSDFLNGSASIQILKRDPFDLTQYTEIHNAKLNFTSFVESNDIAEIGSEARYFNDLIKSLGKTKYDIPVSELTSGTWRYAHNDVFVIGDYELPEGIQTVLGKGAGKHVNQSVSFVLNDVKIPIGGSQNDFRPQSLSAVTGGADGAVIADVIAGNTGTLPDEYFFMVDPTASRSFSFRLQFKFRLSWQVANLPPINYSPRFFIQAVTESGSRINIVNDLMSYNPASPITDMNWIDYDMDTVITAPSGSKLIMYIFADGLGSGTFDYEIQSFEYFRISYLDKSRVTHDIPVTSPEHLAYALLSRMAGNNTPYSVTIDADTDNPYRFSHYLIAAEAIRGQNNAMYHASFNDFIAYMQFLGYEWDVDEVRKIVIFSKRGKFFDQTATAIDLTREETAGLSIEANQEYAYSTVKVGYVRPDIENANGRFAVCGTFDYSTDYSSSSNPYDSGAGAQNALEIICPYKADPVEIEILSWTRAEKTTDQKTDNDIFMLAGNVNSNGYVIENRDSQYVVTNNEVLLASRWYNVPYIPYFIAKRNASKIGIAVKNMNFTATDAYREAVLFGVISDDIYSGISIVNGLFLPFTYEFEAGTRNNLPEPTNRFGLVSFKWKNDTHRGFIRKLVAAHSDEMANTWVLFGLAPKTSSEKMPVIFRGIITEDSPNQERQLITFKGLITENIQ